MPSKASLWNTFEGTGKVLERSWKGPGKVLEGWGERLGRNAREKEDSLEIFVTALKEDRASARDLTTHPPYIVECVSEGSRI